MKLTKKSFALAISILVFTFSTVSAVEACRCRENCNSSDQLIYKDLSKLKECEWASLYQYRYKNNDNSVYIRVGSDTNIGAAAVKVMGVSTNSSYRQNCTRDGNNNEVGHVVIPKKPGNKEYQIYNDVWESGYRVVDLDISKHNIQEINSRFAGWWSADYCPGYGYVSNKAMGPTYYPPCP